jgi:hypothetical protein
MSIAKAAAQIRMSSCFSTCADMTVAPGTVASTDSADPLPAPTDGYCQVQVSGTRDASDLRVVMKVNLIRTFDQGTQTNIPVFLTWTLLGN